MEEYQIVAKDGKLHLQTPGYFGRDLGELHETWGGTLETRNFLAGNYVLEDVSGMFSKGEKYRIRKPNGDEGYLKKRKSSSDTYVFDTDE
ncbi:hypothetical protein [Longimicrobium sp.]|uniref:hypothetical protein n=1 Tax=Longimicrobium sp. TaxID=2029185 RepID=UPI002B526BFC|nr:hypothetical protein [Longimicrobium sp.]HSU16108.1 hypothetical protein [Longimicrobium sp.]